MENAILIVVITLAIMILLYFVAKLQIQKTKCINKYKDQPIQLNDYCKMMQNEYQKTIEDLDIAKRTIKILEHKLKCE